MNGKKIKAWFFLFRPWSYAATLIPMLIALALAAPSNTMARWWWGLVCATLFQATVNLLNTWGDEKSGVDAVPGAIRTTPQVKEGLVSMNALLAVALSCAAAAGAIGLALCFFREDGQWRISIALLAAGIVGMLGATNYSTGIKFKYRGLGVPFVAFLMGPLEIFVGICILRPADALAHITALSAILSIPAASLVCIIMHGNDMRDIETDRLAGIKTPAIILGTKGSLVLYWTCHLIPYLISSIMIGGYGRMFLLPFMALPLTRRTLTRATRMYLENPKNPQWRNLERDSGGIYTVFGILYAVAVYSALR